MIRNTPKLREHLANIKEEETDEERLDREHMENPQEGDVFKLVDAAGIKYYLCVMHQRFIVDLNGSFWCGHDTFSSFKGKYGYKYVGNIKETPGLITVAENNKAKYDWSKVPKHIKFIATDASSTSGYRVYGYSKEPKYEDGNWVYLAGYALNVGYKCDVKPYPGKPEDSLEKRPS